MAAGLAIAAGTLVALAEGAHQWLLIVRGVRRLDPARGLFWFIWVIVKAAFFGAVAGFIVGWMLGFGWERWHRWQRSRLK